MKRFDGFDRFTMLAIAALISAAVFIGATDNTASVDRAVKKAAKAPTDPKVVAKAEAARLMLEAGQVREAIDGLKAAEAEAPAYGEPHALLGLAYAKTMEYPLAMKEFRLALLIDPDYIDSKSPKFIGKRIKAAVKEAKPLVVAAVGKMPGDAAARATLGDTQYIERMLAGGCE